MTLPEITEVEHLVLHPWETLLVHIDRPIRHPEIDLIRAQVESVLPKGARVLIVDPGVTFEVVVAPESGER